VTDEPMDARRQCTATSKQSGERCKRRPIPGGAVCVMHGGATPAVKAAAEERLAQAEAEKTVRKLWVGLENAAPVTDPVASLQRLAGALEEMANVLGNRVNEMNSIEAGADLAQVRGHAAALDKVTGHLRGLLADMVRLGIAQQRLQLERDQARMVGVAVTEALDAIDAGPEQREVFTRVMLGRLRLAELGEPVAS
jgi:hypothetical protein